MSMGSPDPRVPAWLAAADVFDQLDPDLRAALADAVEVRELRAGDRLVEQGTLGRELFVVGDGLLEIRRRHGELSQRIGVVGPGSLVGEASLLQARPRTADLVALRDSIVLGLSGERFQRVLESAPAATWRLLELLLQRGWKAPAFHPPATVVAVVGLDEEAGARVSERVREAAARAGLAVEQPAPGDWTPTAQTAWSEPADVVLLSVTDGEALDFAVRNADRVLMVTSDTHRPTVSKTEARVVAMLQGRVPPTVVVDAPESTRLMAWAQRRPARPVERLGRTDEDADRLVQELLAPTRSLDWLRRSSLFGGLPEPELAALAARFEWVTVDAGETLFARGDAADALYVVVSGRLEVLIGDDDALERLLLLGPGETVGEMGLFRQEGRTATVRAHRATVVARLSRLDYEAVAALDPGVARRVVELVIERLSPARTRRRQVTAQVFALIPLDRGPEAALAAEGLVASLRRLGRVRLVDRARVERELGATMADVRRGAPGEASLVHLLHLVEDGADFVVLLADPDDTGWTRRCRAQADAVVLVADAETKPQLRPFERTLWGAGLAGGEPGTSILLLQPSWAESASGTAAWLDERELDRWVHVRRDTPGDFDRAARLLTRRAVGVAFSGGGSRGAAHLGVIRALQEDGIPVDCTSGTSAGGAIAGLVARGVDLAQATRHVEDLLGGIAGHFAGLGPPLVSVLSGRHVQRLLDPWFSSLHIEDLLRPLVLVATDLSTGQIAPITRGPVWRAVRASTSIPGLWPPVVRDGRLHVDGGVVDNVPADVLAPWTERGTNIASDVADLGPSAERYLPMPHASLSGWRVLAERFVPGWRKPRPSLGGVVTRTMLLAGSREQAASLARHCDVVVRPQLRGGMFDIRDPAGVAWASQIGYAAAVEALEGFSWLDESGWSAD